MVATQVTRQMRDSITIEVTLSLAGSMLEAEEAIQDALNEVGLLAAIPGEATLQRNAVPLENPRNSRAKSALA